MGQKISPTHLNLGSLANKIVTIISNLMQQSKVLTACRYTNCSSKQSYRQSPYNTKYQTTRLWNKMKVKMKKQNNEQTEDN
jgi:hypothetical protein